MPGHKTQQYIKSLMFINPFSFPFIKGTCQQFTLSYPPKGNYSCPGSNITYTCVLCSSFAGVTTVWKGSAFTCPSTENHAANQLSLSQKSGGASNPTAGGSCGNLSAVTTNVSTNGYCYTSVLTTPAVQGLNGSTVMCVDGVTGAVVGNDTVIVKVAGRLGCTVYYISAPVHAQKPGIT